LYTSAVSTRRYSSLFVVRCYITAAKPPLEITHHAIYGTTHSHLADAICQN